MASLACQAQTNFAVSAGYNHNTARVLIDNVKQPTGYLPGFNISARVKTAFEPPLHFVGLIAYNLRNATIEPLSGTVEKKEINIHYLDLAPLLSFDFAAGSKRTITLTAGPMLGMALGGRQKITENQTTTASPMKFSMSGNYGFANIAILSGISFQFNKLFVEATYHLGVNSINNEEEFDNTNIKNRGFALSLGYWLK